MTGKATFRQDYIDTRKQIAAAHLALPEGTNQGLYSVLLHVKDRKIAGIETLVQHVTPDARLKPIALTYPEGLQLAQVLEVQRFRAQPVVVA